MGNKSHDQRTATTLPHTQPNDERFGPPKVFGKVKYVRAVTPKRECAHDDKTNRYLPIQVKNPSNQTYYLRRTIFTDL